ncbi:uncharacterized protein LOC100575782 [Acyrthosiphon pisum]|uniref:C2H2-type domain-containing protein n=1 Tax=Acyrthosiphon pisum TaxID=7029 RepID=A0A8R2D1K9_ACYPI|nr:uncharacterized protein LOC100575782 [Acyrthosiphon pisum]XP_016656260.1 uncharacterized protein LOC100575782 [Acyrthosiphon pisum]|eukprot:XP_003241437.1 PREDICTED: uncharacterized protein LOC100575782 [Acyrthosiphon pisum]
MDDFLRLVTSDFERIATSTGFRFNQYSGSVDWEYLEEFAINDVVEKADVKTLSMLVASVLSYNIEKMSASKKLFRLSQLIIDFLLHYKKHSTFKINDKADSMALCELCGKMFMDVSYLKYHCFRRHKLNSCTFTSSPENDNVDSLKSEIFQLQTQLKEITSTFENKLKNSKMYIDEHDLNNCNSVHKNKLLYHLIPQPGDNPMQIQEMYWKQKYESLEENYNTLKNEYEVNQNSSKSKTILHHKYQQCDFYESQNSSKCIQTNLLIENSTPVCSPKRPPRTIDAPPMNKYKGICSMDISDIDQTNTDCYQCKTDLSSDRDFYELKKLRLEARLNINDNSVCENLSEPLLSSDYVDSLKIVLILGEDRVNELFKNTSLMDLIKLDVKELVNKRLEECYRFIDESVEQDNCLHEMCENQESSEVTICEDNKKEQYSSPEIDCNKTSVKKDKTVMSKLKKKALRLGNIFSPNSKNKKLEVQASTKEEPEILQSNEQLNKDIGNALYT